MGQIILGVALVALVVMTGGTAAAPLAMGMTSMGSVGVAVGTVSTLGTIAGMGVGSMLMGMGVNLIISGVMAMMMKPPKLAVHGAQTTDSEARADNKIFAGLQNTTQSNTPISIVYGRTRVGGQFISGEILSIQHGRNESIKVSALFPPGAN